MTDKCIADGHHGPASDRSVVLGIALILAVYVLAAWARLPQKGTAMIAAGAEATRQQVAEGFGPEAAQRVGAAARASDDLAASGEPAHPPYWMVLPFVSLLIAIAVLPLSRRTAPWWESNLHRFYVAAGLGLLTLLYYLLLYQHPVTARWPAEKVVAHNPGGLNFGVTCAVLANALLNEYLPFIVLLFTLYTISGGIRIEGDLPAHPLTNTLFLAGGAVLASIIGTTGAAMLLIRPLLQTNAERKHVKHTVVLFIFIVCNCGGCLLPLGDPPLFLGYLFGVRFFWTLALWPEWLFVNALLLTFYYLWDRFWYYPRETAENLVREETQVRPLKFSGVWPNGLLLMGVVASVALLDPGKPLPGTNWHPWLYLREIAQLGLVALSLTLGARAVRRANRFNYGAILEVAALFLGIFICMQAPLEILHVRGPALGLTAPAHFFWASGSLSSVLDNAPTYVVFFETARSLTPQGTLVAGVNEALLKGVSLGSVFMGSMTYIGNGPNFMVKTIAEKSGVPMPSFFGYLLYSCGILLPLLILTTLLFL